MLTPSSPGRRAFCATFLFFPAACGEVADPAAPAYATSAHNAGDSADSLAAAIDSAGTDGANTVGPSDSAADAAPKDLEPADAVPELPAAPDVAADVPPQPSYTFVDVSCASTPTAGAVLASPPKPYSGGTCPKLVTDGQTLNNLISKGVSRQFKVIAPKDSKPGEVLPVLFAWHWLKGSANSFVEQGELISAVEKQRFVAVVPESKNDITIPIPGIKNPISFPWPILGLNGDGRFEEEHSFFDDMLACVSEQLPVNKECVAVTGVSAGALYGAQLAVARSSYISSFISLSGGVKSAGISNGFLNPYKTPAHKLPMIVLWGGPSDSCALVNFQEASKALETGLDGQGQFAVECIHNCGHGVPPIEPPAGQSKFKFLWEFAFSHPFWLPPGASPWAKALPADAPPWCAIGSSSAKPRTGACDAPGCPI